MNAFLYYAAIISTGLFAGLMMTLVFLLQRQWLRQSKEEFVVYFREFLLVAKGHPLITFLSFASFVIPIYLGTQTNEGALLLYMSGVVFFVGCFVVTVFLNLPIYKRVIAWKTPSDGVEWQEVRSKFFLLNAIRFGSALLSLILLLWAR